MKTIRRYLVVIGALVLAFALVAGLAVSGYGGAVAAPGAAPSAAYTGAEMAPLPEASCVLDTTVTPQVRTCDLWAKAGSLAMPDGALVPVWGFAATADGPALVPGPVIRANPGETLVVNVTNSLAGESVSLAVPGWEGIPDLAGVATGLTKSYTFPDVKAGTFLYEAGQTAGGARQVAMGLAGPLLVGAAPAGSQEVVLVFGEIDPAFNADPVGYSLIQFRAKYWLINGKAFPDTGFVAAPAGGKLLLRYLNAGVEPRSVGILGLNQTVLAADGEALPFPRGAVVEPLGAGQTREVEVQVPANAATDTLYPLYNGSLHQHNNNQRLADGTMRAAFGGTLAMLKVTGGVTPGGLGPVASAVSVTPAKSDGLVALTLAATLTDDDTNVTACEYFLDTVGAPGTGVACTVGTPGPAVVISEQVPAAALAALASGEHTAYVRGQDALANWGVFGSAAFVLDKAGPVLSGAAANPNPTNGTVAVNIIATANDAEASNVVAGEYRIDGGAWVPGMAVSPANAPVAGLSATISQSAVAALAEGTHTVEVRAQDAFANWSVTPATIALNVDKTGPAVSSATLSPNIIDLNQPLPATVRLTATLDDPLVGGLQSPIVYAEGFVGTLGTPGKGFALYPSDGLFDEPNESAYYNIPGSAFATIGSGVKNVYILGKDKAGNWGVAGTAQVTILPKTADTTGPVVSNVLANPNPVSRNGIFTLTATATDAQTSIAGAVWFIGTNPARAKLTNMAAADGSFNSLTENLTATIDARSLKVGANQVSVRARDALGNWGPIVTITVTRQ